eukprot:3445999-Amphidinium_carterae.1
MVTNGDADGVGIDASSLTLNALSLGNGCLLRPLTENGLAHLLCGVRGQSGLCEPGFGFEVTGFGPLGADLASLR